MPMQMKMSVEERFRKKVTSIARKNDFCRILMLPLLFAGLFWFHGIAYLKGNVKRFSMLIMTCLLFTVYSSFSFPMFISGDGTSLDMNDVSEEAQDIVLAEEIRIDPEELKRIEDETEVDEDWLLTVHGTDIETKYSAADILESTQPNGAGEGRVADGEEAEFSQDDWKLILINSRHSIPDDYEFPQGDIHTMKGTMHCDARIIDDLLDMLRAAKEQGITLQICSPYRDEAYQEHLFDQKIKKYMSRGMSYMEAYRLGSQVVNVPGASEHQLGLALDIVMDTYTGLDEGFADTEGGKWLAQNSYKYGFILRYPEGKEYITGISYEPWHFRYVGVDAATVITERGITLEEFWEEL